MVTIPHQVESPSPVEPNPQPRKQFNAYWERWYPLLGGIVAAAACAWASPSNEAVYKALGKTLDSAVGVAAVLAGFQATAMGLLMALAETPQVKKLRRHGHYGVLVEYHWKAISFLAACALVAIILLAAQGVAKDYGVYSLAIGTGFLGLAVTAMLSTLRVTRLMFKLLRWHDRESRV